MKCVKDIKSGIVTRVSNDRAAEMVAKGTHKYTSKDEWKRGGRKR